MVNKQTKHSKKIKQLISKYSKEGYNVVLTHFHPRRPDIFMVSPEGKPIWVEVEEYQHESNKKRFSNIQKYMDKVDGEFKLIYITKQISKKQVKSKRASFCPYCGKYLRDNDLTKKWNMGSPKGGVKWVFRQWKCSKCKERGKGEGSFRTQEVLDDANE